jgi:hypothetical protein
MSGDFGPPAFGPPGFGPGGGWDPRDPFAVPGMPGYYTDTLGGLYRSKADAIDAKVRWEQNQGFSSGPTSGNCGQSGSNLR